jgi:hypothetical protein
VKPSYNERVEPADVPKFWPAVDGFLPSEERRIVQIVVSALIKTGEEATNGAE